MRQDVLVMENLFYDRKIDKVFDDTLNMATPQLGGGGGGIKTRAGRKLRGREVRWRND